MAESDDPADLRRSHSIKCLDPGRSLFLSDFQPGHEVSEQSENESPTAGESGKLHVLNLREFEILNLRGLDILEL